MGKLYEQDYDRKFTKDTTNHYAVDLASDVLYQGVVYDIEVVKQSITNIILTMMGERLFNLQFGTNLYGLLFNSSMTVMNAQALKSHIIDRVLTYEKRVSITEEESIVIFDPNLNELRIVLTFNLKASAESAVWSNTIVL